MSEGRGTLLTVAKRSNIGDESNLALASCAEQRQSVLELKVRCRISALDKFLKGKTFVIPSHARLC